MLKKIVLLGKKIGMTRIFDETGSQVPVTVLEVIPSKIVDKKEKSKNGYDAVVAVSGDKKNSHMKKTDIGFAKKYSIASFRSTYEIRSKNEEVILPNIGDELSIEDCSLEKTMKITSRSKGKGFQGVVKRWNFSTQDASHGNSISHRAPGSIGGNQPGRVWKGKKMSGRMGNQKYTLNSRKLISIEKDKSLVLLKGSVPGHNGTEVIMSQEV